MIKKIILPLICLISAYNFCFTQVSIDNYVVNNLGQAQLTIQAQADKYYIVNAQHNPTFNWAISMMKGFDGTMIISDPGGSYPLENYTITEHDIATPDDFDGDGMNDIVEFDNMPTDAPLNFANPISFTDGTTSIPDAQTFMDLGAVNDVPWAPFLNGQHYVKFGILDRDGPEPKVYFINSNTHFIHAGFFTSIGAVVNGDDGSGEIVFNPNDLLPNGSIGSYSFNFSFGDAYDFEDTQRTYELLVANMPFLQNNMKHFISENSEDNYNNQYANDFVGSRIVVDLESDVFDEINYIPFHQAEGYGFFKHMSNLSETPGSRDIVLYDALPNSLPRVGGIITSVIQTPLSHVNLRAIQDNVPNAYIEDPLSIDSIANLLGGYIYYKVEDEKYIIREATLSEVNAWYEELRPEEPQIPVRDLSFTEILSLDDIEFGMSTAFGAKCSNVATMRTFGFPEGTIPDGFGIPFYYYDEFMKYNNFYQEAQVMIDNPVFQNDINFRTERLKDFRRDIKDAPMPPWILDDLQVMHDAFPEGTAVRCRSSTNNEDLPGFSGAGLYTSKTQHLDEGHISKSIKQVYASMWNFRAYEERDFYRVDHFKAAMGVLCHPNFKDEKSNGVGISIDPIYETEGTYYLNTQVGESLITNPDPNSVPEEILLYQNPLQGGGYLVLRLSNLVNDGELVMDEAYLDQMRDYLTVIHDKFAILYDVVGVDGFGMDIEYKVTAQDQLVIKQARPWVSFWANVNANNDLAITAITEPVSSSTLGNNELVTATIANQGLNDMSDFDIKLVVDGQLMETINITNTIEPFSEIDFQFTVPQDFSAIGDYNIMGIVSDVDDEYDSNDTLNIVLSKMHALDAALSIEEPAVIVCNGLAEVTALVTNNGETTINEVEFQIVVNGLVVDVATFPVTIPFQEQEMVVINIDNNIQVNDQITLNLLSVNIQLDGNLTNNLATTTITADSDYNFVTLIINADNFSQETSWELIENGTNLMIASGDLEANVTVFSEDICLDYTSCYSLYVYDSYGDGMCCDYGMGNFELLDAFGNTILINDGDFGSKAKEVFCPDGTGCSFAANVNVSHITSESTNDGTITINPSLGVGPYQYSIDGGQNLVSSNTFTNLTPGNYSVYVQDASGLCSYDETVTVETCTFTTVDIEATATFSVVTENGSIVINPTSGVGPYQYSIDGGVNFVSNNVFENLPVGNYNVVVQDASSICLYEGNALINACDITVDIVTANASSSAVSDGAISIYLTPGTNAFEYSIDGGQNFLTNNEFMNLSPGTYVVVVQILTGGCIYEQTVTVEADMVNSISDLSSNGIKIYPNPTFNHFNIEIESSVTLSDKLNVEVYDNLGRIIITGAISDLNTGKTSISLDNHVAGTYFVKCYNGTFEKYFKIIKI